MLALLVLRLQRVRVLLGSHAERGPLAGDGTEEAKINLQTIWCLHAEIWRRRCCICTRFFLTDRPVLLSSSSMWSSGVFGSGGSRLHLLSRIGGNMESLQLQQA